MLFDSSALENLIDQSDVFESDEYQTEALRRCVKKLSRESQELLKMRYVQGDSVPKIAEQVNRTTAHLYRVISKIHNALLKCIRLQLTS
jgi:DNA-directed RNA polymerase specialized sigma subunit